MAGQNERPFLRDFSEPSLCSGTLCFSQERGRESRHPAPRSERARGRKSVPAPRGRAGGQGPTLGAARPVHRRPLPALPRKDLPAWLRYFLLVITRSLKSCLREELRASCIPLP